MLIKEWFVSCVWPDLVICWASLLAQLGKESTCSAGDLGSVPGWGRSPGGGHGNPLQYSCLENPTDRGARRAAAQRVAKSWTRLSAKAQHADLLGRGGEEVSSGLLTG